MKNDFFRSQFRLPGDLYDKLKEASESNGRSLNAEIVARLEGSFGPDITDVLSDLLDAQTSVIVESIKKCLTLPKSEVE